MNVEETNNKIEKIVDCYKLEMRSALQHAQAELLEVYENHSKSDNVIHSLVDRMEINRAWLVSDYVSFGSLEFALRMTKDLIRTTRLAEATNE